jgi:hypothetical protein
LRLGRLVPLLVVSASIAGCEGIIGADFGSLRSAPPCSTCGTGGAESARTGGSSGADGKPSAGGTASGGRSSGESGMGTSGRAGASAGSLGIGESGSAGEGGTSTLDPCVSNADCIERHDNRPYICRRSSCVPVTTEDCPVVLPSAGGVDYLKRERPFLIGGFASVNAPFYEDPASVNWDLAFTEFNEATRGGLANGTRPLVGVVCNSDLPDILPGLRHLALDLAISGTLSTLPPERLLAAFEHTTSREYIDDGGKLMLFLADDAADSRLANLMDRGLIWHMLGSPRVLSAATAGLVRHIEPLVQTWRAENYLATGVDDPATSLRLTLVTADDVSLLDAASVLTAGDIDHPSSNLTFNGALAVSQPGLFRRVDIESAGVHAPYDVQAGVNELLWNPPHIIVALAGEELTDLLAAVEAGWGQTGNTLGHMRPFWVVYASAAHSVTLPATLAAFASVVPPPSRRLAGVSFASSVEERAQLLTSAYRFRLFDFYRGDRLVPVLSGTENHYDAAYSLLYAHAAAAANGSYVSPTDLREALEDRVFSPEPGAKSISVGPAYVPDGVGALGTLTDRMALYGTMGPLDFERSSGTRVSATSAWCVEPGNPDQPYVYDALLYDAGADVYSLPQSGPASCVPSGR